MTSFDLTKAAAMNFTTCVAIDDEHCKELELSYPTWVKHKREILRNPLLLICDGDQHDQHQWIIRTSFIEQRLKIVLAHIDGCASQREKMLTALVHLPHLHVETDWYLKLDTDAVALDNSKWIHDNWFDNHTKFIASPWSYTKPANALDTLDEWANCHAAFWNTKPMNVPHVKNARRVCCSRIISWLMFVKTSFSARCSRLADNRKRLPVPSQDTFLWYVAQRMELPYVTTRFKKLGWNHCNRKKLANACRTSLGVA